MQRRQVWWAVAMAMAVVGTARAEIPAPQPLASKWQLDYSLTACRLLASFGTAGDTVEFAQDDPRQPLKLTLVSKAWPRTTVARPVGVSTGDPNNFLPLQSAPLPQMDDMRLIHIPLAIGLREALEAKRTLGEPVMLSASVGGRTRTYAVGKVAPLLSALDRCMDDLVRTWGFDPDEQRFASAPTPVGSPAAWLNASDYPAALANNGATGGVNLRLTINPEGRLTGCNVQETGGAKDFQELSCRLLKERARYNPAIDKAGRAITSYVTYRVRWRVSSSYVSDRSVW